MLFLSGVILLKNHEQIFQTKIFPKEKNSKKWKKSEGGVGKFKISSVVRRCIKYQWKIKKKTFGIKI